MSSEPIDYSDAELAEGRQAPHNLDAEQGVLGGLLLEPDRWDMVEGRLEEDDFFSPAYGTIFAAMNSVRKRGKPIDLLVLKDELVTRGELESVGGSAALAALADAVPTGAHVEYYAQIVRDHATRRRLIRASGEIIERAATSHETTADIVDHAERSIFNVATRGTSGDARSIENVLHETWEKIEQYQEQGHQGAVTGLPSGFYELDNLTAGLHEDELIIVAGRPSMGKSTFAINIARHLAVDENMPVVLYSLEMSAENIVRNLLAMQSRIDAQRLRTLRLTTEDMTELQRASDVFLNAPIFIDDTPAISLAELRGKTRRLKARKGIKACFVDYLQLMMASSTAQGRSREQEVSEISRGLKALAKELQIPVIALSQLSRKPSGRQDNRPILSDLRESGAIEQDADVVMLIHRPSYYNKDEAPGEAEIIVAKQRNGPTDTVNLAFLGNLLRFENLSGRSDQGYAPDPDEDL